MGCPEQTWEPQLEEKRGVSEDNVREKDNGRLVGDWVEEKEMLKGEVQSAGRGL